MRPLYILDRNSFRITKKQVMDLDRGIINWNNLMVGGLNTNKINAKNKNEVEEGVIEYLDVQEEDTRMICIMGTKLNS